jgi:hypothetical protein
MARRSVPPPRPKTPILTVGQKRRRIDRLQKCITNLEAFDPQKVRKRAPAVLALEAAIDKALSSAFGYGTPAYLQYNEAATLDPSPLLTTAVRAAVSRPVGGPARHDTKVQEARHHFSENKNEQSPCFSKQSAASKKRSPRLDRRWRLRTPSKRQTWWRMRSLNRSHLRR